MQRLIALAAWVPAAGTTPAQSSSCAPSSWRRRRAKEQARSPSGCPRSFPPCQSSEAPSLHFGSGWESPGPGCRGQQARIGSLWPDSMYSGGSGERPQPAVMLRSWAATAGACRATGAHGTPLPCTVYFYKPKSKVPPPARTATKVEPGAG